MKVRGINGCIAVMACCCALGAALPGVSPGQKLDRKEILRQARQSYYSLKNEGLAEFQCSVVPNWETLLADQRKKDPSAADAAVRKLNGLLFSVSLGLDGNAKVTHNEIPAENEQVAKGLSQIYSGMEQMTSGFFQTWSAFMISPALPEVDSVFQLEELGPEYRLSYKDGAADVVTNLGKDFAISNSRVSTQEFNSTLQPQFKKTARGFLLTGYGATYRGASGADATELQVAIDYQQVDGLQLPQKLDLKGSYGGNPFHVEVQFAGCRVKKN